MHTCSDQDGKGQEAGSDPHRLQTSAEDPRGQITQKSAQLLLQITEAVLRPRSSRSTSKCRSDHRLPLNVKVQNDKLPLYNVKLSVYGHPAVLGRETNSKTHFRSKLSLDSTPGFSDRPPGFSDGAGSPTV